MLGSETWIVLGAGAVSATIAAVIAWLIRKRELEPEDVTIGFLGPSLAAMYLLVLALALATEWQTIGSAQQAVGNEAVAVRQLYWAATGLPPAAANQLRADVRAYTTTVVSHDWPQLEHATLDDRSEQQLSAMTTSLLRLNPSTSAAATAQQYALAQTSAIASARAQRESAAGVANCRPACWPPSSGPRSSCACSRSPAGYGRPDQHHPGRPAGGAGDDRRRRGVPAEQPVHRSPGDRAGSDRVGGQPNRGQPDRRRVRAVPSAAATLAVAAPLALAGLPGPRVLTLGISGEGSPRAGHAYTYLVSVDDTARAPGWLVHLDVSAPAGATVVSASGACRTGPGGASCVWPQLAGGSAVGVSVTVSLAPGLRAGTSLIATARLSYDWGQLTDSATSVRTVSAPARRGRG